MNWYLLDAKVKKVEEKNILFLVKLESADNWVQTQSFGFLRISVSLASREPSLILYMYSHLALRGKDIWIQIHQQMLLKLKHKNLDRFNKW